MPNRPFSWLVRLFEPLGRREQLDLQAAAFEKRVGPVQGTVIPITELSFIGSAAGLSPRRFLRLPAACDNDVHGRTARTR